MSLLIPNVDEACFKQLAKRIQKGLAARQESGAPSLVQTQELLAHALGYANLHAAQQAWRPSPPAPDLSSRSLWSADQCAELRDRIFEQTRFPNPEGILDHLFFFMAVTPGSDTDDQAVATIHYAYSERAWEREGVRGTPTTVLAKALATLRPDVKFAYQEWPRTQWPCAWKDTVKAPHLAFPTLVAIALPDGTYTGAVVQNSYCEGEVKVAKRAREPEEALALVHRLRALPEHAWEQLDNTGWYKDRNVQGPTLEALLDQTPFNEVDQKGIVLYRDNEWWDGLINGPTSDHPGLTLGSVADFHGIKVSKAKRAKRPSVDLVRQRQTAKGDPKVLTSALTLVSEHNKRSGNKEGVPALQMLCRWWDKTTNVGPTGYCRLYVWNDKAGMFDAMDPEWPATDANAMASSPTYAVFDMPAASGTSHLVVAEFYQGRAHNTRSPEYAGSTLVHYADGSVAYESGEDIDDLDDARYGIIGLLELKAWLAKH